MDNEFLSVQLVLNTIKLTFASAKGLLNYELRITNYEFGRRSPNSNLNVYHFPYYTPFRPESQALPPLEREKRAAPLGGRVRLSLFYGVRASIFPSISTGSPADPLSMGTRIAQ